MPCLKFPRKSAYYLGFNCPTKVDKGIMSCLLVIFAITSINSSSGGGIKNYLLV